MVRNLILLMIPFIFTIYLYLKSGAEAAIEKSVIPFMILVPFSFKVFLSPYIPDLSFYSCAIIPLLIISLVIYKIKIDISIMDILVLLYVLVCSYVGLESTDNRFGFIILSKEAIETLIPYFIVRCFIEKERTLRFLTILSIFISITAFLAPIEFFFNRNIAHIYQLIWGGNGLWAPFIRYGFYRVHSTYGHPIHAGVLFSISIIISLMLYNIMKFDNRKKYILLIGINILAMIMTISRASYIVIIPTIFLFYYSIVKNKKIYAISYIIILILSFSIGNNLYNDYLEVKPGEIPTEAKQSAYYRKLLVENYIELAKEKLQYGYGARIPVLDGQFSIDNYYLLLVLRFGVIPLILFILMHLIVIIKSIILTKNYTKRENMILWCLTAIIFYYSILNFSVWETAQAKIILFMIFALATNYTGKNMRNIRIKLIKNKWE